MAIDPERDDDFEELAEAVDSALVDDEPIGPAPLEYKCVLVFAIALVLGALAWGWLSNSSCVLTK